MNYIIRGMISLVIFGCVFIVLKVIKAKQIERENCLLEAYMKALEDFCNEIQQKIEATRRYRHDLKGYIQTLEAILGSDSKNEAVKQYIEEQKERHSRLSNSLLCKDEMIDAILRIKKSECSQKDICLNVEISEGNYSGMEEMDKVCLITNLIDNAIEATERMDKIKRQAIYLKIEGGDGQMRIYQENGLEQDEEFSFHTKKVDKYYHGLGTTIIEQVLQKYAGTRTLVVNKERHVLQDELCLTMREETV